MKKIEIFTDGGCRGNPGPGAWAALLRYGSHEKMLSGTEHHTTNNRMELMAVIEGLGATQEACDVTIYTDSQYVSKGMSEWIEAWQARGWKTASKKPVANADLWQQLLAQADQHQIQWQWVKGHAGHEENERVDRQCNIELDKLQKENR